VLQPQLNNTHNLSFQQVYDHDMFSADDIMGEAEIDLQPMITLPWPLETLHVLVTCKLEGGL
jgi:hypothetical protein